MILLETLRKLEILKSLRKSIQHLTCRKSIRSLKNSIEHLRRSMQTFRQSIANCTKSWFPKVFIWFPKCFYSGKVSTGVLLIYWFTKVLNLFPKVIYWLPKVFHRCPKFFYWLPKITFDDIDPKIVFDWFHLAFSVRDTNTWYPT